MPIKAAVEVSTSLRWCQASAVTAVLPISVPTASTLRKRISLQMITPPNTTSVKAAGAWWGVRISRTARIMMLIAAAINIRATMAAAIESALP